MQASHSMQASTIKLMDDCQDIVESHLRPHLDKMFENTDLAFLEFAEKAESNWSQIRFIEAMTLIQKNRNELENTFYSKLEESFSGFGSLNTQAFTTVPDSNAQLSLVSVEDTDEMVAIHNMVSSATQGSTHALHALRQRLAILNHGQKLKEHEIPGGPTNLARSFREAVAGLTLEHETKLIVYLLFDKFVLSKTYSLYDTYNEFLLQAGLLPNLKYELRKNPHAQATPLKSDDAPRQEGTGNERHMEDSGAGDTDTGQSLGDELFNNILQLIAHRNAQANGADSGQKEKTRSGAGDESVVANPVPQTELVSVIHNLQQSMPEVAEDSPGVVERIPAARPDKDRISSLVARLSVEREQLFEGIDRRRIPGADSQVIDLVGMMFEFMLKDEELPSAAKVLLSRLHTPFLKVAIIDKSFFTGSTHPARELLDKLAGAGTKWVFEDNLDRGIYPCMRTIVERIIGEFENNFDIFPELLVFLGENLRDLDDKAATIEERTRQAIKGKEKLALARKHAATEIEKHTRGRRIPAPARKLLEEVWHDKLMFIYLREQQANHSDSWKLAVQAIDDIVCSVEARSSENERIQLTERLPELRKRIKQALLTLDAYGSTDIDSQLALIADLQEKVLREPITRPVNADEAEVPASRPGNPECTVAPPQSTDLADTKTESSTGHDEKKVSPEFEAALSALQKVAFGTWFLIQDKEDENPVRVKLSWYTQLSGKYMFVDSMGVKAAIKERDELAGLLANGKARIIDEERMPLVQRALMAIRRMLGGDQAVPA